MTTMLNLNNSALEVVIGLAFIYLLYSLLGTFLQEIIATNIGLRGWILKKAIKRMLDDDNATHRKYSKRIKILIDKCKKLDAIWNSRNSKNKAEEKISNHLAEAMEILEKSKIAISPSSKNMSDVFYQHPLIKYFYTGSLFGLIGFRRPAYISKETFSKVVVDLLRGENVKPGNSYRDTLQNSLTTGRIKWMEDIRIERETLSYLVSIWADTQGDVQKFQGSLELWFTEMMERTTGWYKRYTQLILLIVGLIIAIGFNVDTLKIVSGLQNPKVREKVISQATEFTKAHPTLDQELQKIKTESKSPEDLFNVDTSYYRKSKELRERLYKQALDNEKDDIGNVNNLLAIGWHGKFFGKDYCKYSIVGWILTALAISLGASFWFDLLNRIMKLRGSVAPKKDNNAKSTDSTKKKDTVG
jgi:hypothetical protein